MCLVFFRDFSTTANNICIDKTKPLWHNYFLCGFKGIQVNRCLLAVEIIVMLFQIDSHVFGLLLVLMLFLYFADFCFKARGGGRGYDCLWVVLTGVVMVFLSTDYASLNTP
jgi:hypothetical protein